MTSGTFKAAFVRSMLTLHPVLRPMIRLVKAWARNSGLNDPTQGGLNSYCLTLLAIAHLQQLANPLLPPVWQLYKEGPPVDPALPDPVEPASDDRPMHDGARPAQQAAEMCAQNAVDWLSVNRPDPRVAPCLDDLLMSFFVRLAALLLARWTNSGDACWRTVSTWYSITGRCMCQKHRVGSRHLTVGQLRGGDEVTGDADWPAMLRSLLVVLAQHWPRGQPGRVAALRGAVARVRACAQLMLYDDELPGFDRFAGELLDGFANEPGEQGAAAAGVGVGVGVPQRAAGRGRKQRHRLEGINTEAMRDVVIQILVAVPYDDTPPVRGQSGASASAVETNGADGEDVESGSGEDAEEGGGEEAGWEGGGARDEGGEEYGGRVAGVDGERGGEVAQENDPRLAAAVAAVRGGSEGRSAHGSASPVRTLLDEDMLILNIDYGEAGEDAGAVGTDSDAEAGVGEAAQGDGDAMAVAGDAGQSNDCLEAGPDAVVTRTAAAPGLAGKTEDAAASAEAAVAAAAAALSQAGISGVRGGVDGAGQAGHAAGAGARGWPSGAVAARKALLEMRNQRMQDWRYRCAVEDPFNEGDNAARSLINMDELLTEALLPVLWGEDALRPLLRRPGRAAAAEDNSRELRDLELGVRETAAAAAQYDFPIAQDSPLSAHVRRQVEGWLKDVPPIGTLPKDQGLSQKLQKLYVAAGGTREAVAAAEALRRQQAPRPAVGHSAPQGGFAAAAVRGQPAGLAAAHGARPRAGDLREVGARGVPAVDRAMMATIQQHLAASAEHRPAAAHTRPQQHARGAKIDGRGRAEGQYPEQHATTRPGRGPQHGGVAPRGPAPPIAASTRPAAPDVRGPLDAGSLGTNAFSRDRGAVYPPPPPPGVRHSAREAGGGGRENGVLPSAGAEVLSDDAQVGEVLRRADSGSAMVGSGRTRATGVGALTPDGVQHAVPAVDLAALDARNSTEPAQGWGRRGAGGAARSVEHAAEGGGARGREAGVRAGDAAAADGGARVDAGFRRGAQKASRGGSGSPRRGGGGPAKSRGGRRGKGVQKGGGGGRGMGASRGGGEPVAVGPGGHAASAEPQGQRGAGSQPGGGGERGKGGKRGGRTGNMRKGPQR